MNKRHPRVQIKGVPAMQQQWLKQQQCIISGSFWWTTGGGSGVGGRVGNCIGKTVAAVG
jgi:hypothetical protein